MGKEKGRVGYEDWDKIVKVKEDSLKVIAANKRNIEVGEIVEQLVLKKALKERNKYSKPQTDAMEDDEKQDEKPKEE